MSLFKFPGLFLPERKKLLAVLGKILAPAIRVVTGTAATITADDAGGVIRMTNASANAVTVPTNITLPLDVGYVTTIQQGGAGATTITAAGGVTINRLTGKALGVVGQHGEVTLRKIATNEWLLTGDLASA